MIYSRPWGYDENLNRLGCWSEMYDDMVEEAYRRFYEIRAEKAKEKAREKAREIAREKGREERSYEIARDMIDDGFSAEAVSKYSRLDLSIVNQLMQ